jgi:hypothetical protein
MRLLQLGEEVEISLVEFMTDPPPYAILSHTWGADNEEVTFKEMIKGTGVGKIGYDKIRHCGKQAAKDGLQYIWVDTCCIDKSSSAELSESINSMFKYYQNAEVCYVYLPDVELDSWPPTTLSTSRWLTRGWTLQELLAPRNVKFFDKSFNFFGDKISLAGPLTSGTGIPLPVLAGDDRLSDVSIATRMSWVARRQTKRPEDLAYCLLGIFQVNMPLIYGEGVRAFRRLQDEIVKNSNDLSIFAWTAPMNRLNDYLGLFAASPADFSRSSEIVPFLDDFAGYAVTNRGLHLFGDIELRIAGLFYSDLVYTKSIYWLSLGANRQNSDLEEGIFLRKISPGLFCRVETKDLSGAPETRIPKFQSKYMCEPFGVRQFKDIHIITYPTPNTSHVCSSFRKGAIHIRRDEAFQLQAVSPEELWDPTDSIILRPRNRYSGMAYSMVLAMSFEIELGSFLRELIVLCDYRGLIPELKAFRPHFYPDISQRLFQNTSISWEELTLLAPNIMSLGDSVTVDILEKGGLSSYRISVWLEKAKTEGIFEKENFQVQSLRISCVGTYT